MSANQTEMNSKIAFHISEAGKLAASRYKGFASFTEEMNAVVMAVMAHQKNYRNSINFEEAFALDCGKDLFTMFFERNTLNGTPLPELPDRGRSQDLYLENSYLLWRRIVTNKSNRPLLTIKNPKDRSEIMFTALQISLDKESGRYTQHVYLLEVINNKPIWRDMGQYNQKTVVDGVLQNRNGKEKLLTQHLDGFYTQAMDAKKMCLAKANAEATAAAAKAAAYATWARATAAAMTAKATTRATTTVAGGIPQMAQQPSLNQMPTQKLANQTLVDIKTASDNKYIAELTRRVHDLVYLNMTFLKNYRGVLDIQEFNNLEFGKILFASFYKGCNNPYRLAFNEFFGVPLPALPDRGRSLDPNFENSYLIIYNNTKSAPDFHFYALQFSLDIRTGCYNQHQYLLINNHENTLGWIPVAEPFTVAGTDLVCHNQNGRLLTERFNEIYHLEKDNHDRHFAKTNNSTCANSAVSTASSDVRGMLKTAVHARAATAASAATVTSAATAASAATVTSAATTLVPMGNVQILQSPQQKTKTVNAPNSETNMTSSSFTKKMHRAIHVLMKNMKNYREQVNLDEAFPLDLGKDLFTRFSENPKISNVSNELHLPALPDRGHSQDAHLENSYLIYKRRRSLKNQNARDLLVIRNPEENSEIMTFALQIYFDAKLGHYKQHFYRLEGNPKNPSWFEVEKCNQHTIKGGVLRHRTENEKLLIHSLDEILGLIINAANTKRPIVTVINERFSNVATVMTPMATAQTLLQPSLNQMVAHTAANPNVTVVDGTHKPSANSNK
jgi:hypothetical protein